MVMAKKLYLMGSSTALILIFLVFSSTSCDTIQSNDKDNKEDVATIEKSSEAVVSDSFQKATEFKPDTLINGILTLHSKNSSERFYPKITSEQLVHFVRESPVYIFSNQDDDEYLLAFQYEGGTENEFSCFEIGYTNDLEKRDEKISTDHKRFELESGLKLGLSTEELIKIKGENYTKEDDKIIYRLNDYKSSKFLKRHNMPAYFLECTLKNDRIDKIKFGFDYP